MRHQCDKIATLRSEFVGRACFQPVTIFSYFLMKGFQDTSRPSEHFPKEAGLIIRKGEVLTYPPQPQNLPATLTDYCTTVANTCLLWQQLQSLKSLFYFLKNFWTRCHCSSQVQHLHFPLFQCRSVVPTSSLQSSVQMHVIAMILRRPFLLTMSELGVLGSFNPLKPQLV
jgi:hypothetical protein